MTAHESGIDRIDPVSLKTLLRGGEEIALIDPREEGLFGTSHLLLAVNIPLSKLELRIGRLVPRPATRIILTDGDDGLAERAAEVLRAQGYHRLEILEGGISAWHSAGFELFSGMSVLTKAFGEWIAVRCQTPLITAEELHRRRACGDDILVLDSRPANEYVNMNIPGSINIPGSELVYRFPHLPVNPETLIVVNCAGRTRSLIGAQTLIDAGIPNKVAALRGGTMAWQMAGFELEHHATRHLPAPQGTDLDWAVERASGVAHAFGVQSIDQTVLNGFKAEKAQRSLYIFDVRTPDEFRAGHRPDSLHALGVQLVQSIDKYVATRNSRIVLVDNQRVRALTTAAWLGQIGWGEVFVLEDPFQGIALEQGDVPDSYCIEEALSLTRVSVAEARDLIGQGKTTVIDFSDSISYRKHHIPGARLMIRSRITESLPKIPSTDTYLVTGNDLSLTALAANDLAHVSGQTTALLEGGNNAWIEAGYPVAGGLENCVSGTDDTFRMPFLWGHYEDKDEFEKAAHAYFQWELQLPEQILKADEIEFNRSAGG